MSKYQIAFSDGTSPEVEGEPVGDFLAFRKADGAFIVDHLPTGYMAARLVNVPEAEAKAIAVQLASWGADWNVQIDSPQVKVLGERLEDTLTGMGLVSYRGGTFRKPEERKAV